MTTHIRHHYLPQFYLKGFKDSCFYKSGNGNCIWVYDKDAESMFNSNIKDVACEKHYFSTSDKDGNRDSQTLEKLLGKMESEAAPVISKLLREEC